MARPLRVVLPGGWFHVTARGNERRTIFVDDRDRRRFLELLAELPARFGLIVHAYVLMGNHYHLLVETPQGSLSALMQWLNVSYTVWFNRRHRRSGHLLQGRFKAIAVNRDEWGLALSRYIHLNPVRIGRLGLDKARQRQGRAGVAERASRDVVSARIQTLRAYRWSSYRTYAGYENAPAWLEWRAVLALAGGGPMQRRQEEYRHNVEELVREGWDESPWEQVTGGLALGKQTFVERVRKLAKGNAREQSALKGLRRRVEFERVVKAVESVKGERWEAFRDRHGDWGRDATLYLGRKHGGLTLAALGKAVGGMDYGTVSEAVRRMQRRITEDKDLAQTVARAEDQLLNI